MECIVCKKNDATQLAKGFLCNAPTCSAYFKVGPSGEWRECFVREAVQDLGAGGLTKALQRNTERANCSIKEEREDGKGKLDNGSVETGSSFGKSQTGSTLLRHSEG